jgi:hypothetical protein
MKLCLFIVFTKLEKRYVIAVEDRTYEEIHGKIDKEIGPIIFDVHTVNPFSILVGRQQLEYDLSFKKL